MPPTDPDVPMPLSRAERRRLREADAAQVQRIRASRDAFLLSQMEPNETIVARSERHPLVTDRRILWARPLHQPPPAGEWDLESLAFDQITGWAPGRQHDGRPRLRLDHVSVLRMEHVPEHRFLWFEWGNAEAPFPRTTTSLAFSRDSDPVLVALRDALERASVPQRAPFVVRPEGTREQRMPSHGTLTYGPSPRWARMRSRWWDVGDRLYGGRIKWWLRLLSWAVLALPAWFIEPWLVVPAVVLAEAAWIVLQRHSRRHDRPY
jgi:hypothetical protein